MFVIEFPDEIRLTVDSDEVEVPGAIAWSAKGSIQQAELNRASNAYGHGVNPEFDSPINVYQGLMLLDIRNFTIVEGKEMIDNYVPPTFPEGIVS